MNQPAYDALLFVSFGGPERQEDVLPFLENVLRGRPVPRERMLEVATHYEHFEGASPINQQIRELIDGVRNELARRGLDLPIYWGNRNWHPLLPDTLQEMTAAGVRRALAFVTSPYSSYSSCRQYLQNIEDARAAAGPSAPQVDKIRAFFNHPQFIAASAARLQESLSQLPAEERSLARIVYTAHSIPVSQANTCRYVTQLQETCRLVSSEAGIDDANWKLVYQSRSGRPEDPWLGPDILDWLTDLRSEGTAPVVIVPIGFLSDHMEVLYDLDVEAAERCRELELPLVRAATVGTHPLFISAIVDLIEERLDSGSKRPAVGLLPASHDVCPSDCCPAPFRRR